MLKIAELRLKYALVIYAPLRVTRLGYFPPKWLLLTSLWRAKNPLAGTRQISKKWLFLAFSSFCGKNGFF
jgi:hypothetical protein